MIKNSLFFCMKNENNFYVRKCVLFKQDFVCWIYLYSYYFLNFIHFEMCSISKNFANFASD